MAEEQKDWELNPQNYLTNEDGSFLLKKLCLTLMQTKLMSLSMRKQQLLVNIHTPKPQLHRQCMRRFLPPKK